MQSFVALSTNGLELPGRREQAKVIGEMMHVVGAVKETGLT